MSAKSVMLISRATLAILSFWLVVSDSKLFPDAVEGGEFMAALGRSVPGHNGRKA